MQIEKRLRVKVPRQKVWDTIMDIPATISLIPGIQKVEAIDSNTYRSVLKVKVAYISATFELVTKMTNIEPTRHLETVTEGKAFAGLGRVNQKQYLDLISISEDETEALYKAEVIVAGRLATLGEKLFRA